MSAETLLELFLNSILSKLFPSFQAVSPGNINVAI
jgi:hypothetical protein